MVVDYSHFQYLSQIQRLDHVSKFKHTANALFLTSSHLNSAWYIQTSHLSSTLENISSAILTTTPQPSPLFLLSSHLSSGVHSHTSHLSSTLQNISFHTQVGQSPQIHIMTETCDGRCVSKLRVISVPIDVYSQVITVPHLNTSYCMVVSNYFHPSAVSHTQQYQQSPQCMTPQSHLSAMTPQSHLSSMNCKTYSFKCQLFPLVQCSYTFAKTS